MTALRLARPDDLPKLLPLVEAFHEHIGAPTKTDHCESALSPLLEGNPLGVVYLIGPRIAPIGYIVISFGWSVEYGGMIGTVDQVFLRPSVRGRGIGHEVLSELPKALADAGLKAMNVQIPFDDEAAQRFYSRLHFKQRNGIITLTREG
ncbi:GNAT family N-acetyltransferase [Thalassobius sp. Cn5-15]|uniref:GNAT family N-acetyltransferase n=1 Tax=Thalassobius sp. Cn5-15 TaxID=2917763 RepID=UPI001EF37B9A|nr:GNAT family N-acetyltransferase [Thalassobius sp. Cn5-15]MCG7492317.1 GNAT family N-acetyltransferase [Thalassobius sp. Cn5-15]